MSLLIHTWGDKKAEEELLACKSDDSGDGKPGAKRRKIFDKEASSIISRDDIRYTYPPRYYAAINSGCKEDILSFLNDVALPEVVFLSKLRTIRKDSFVPAHLEVKGIDGCGVFFEKMLTAIPDVMMEHSDVSIQMFKDGETIIWSKFSIQGSKVFELNGLEEGGNQKVVVSRSSSLSDTSLGESATSPESAVAEITSRVVDSSSGATVEVNSRVEFGVGASKPANCFSSSGTVTFHLNKEGRVYLIASIKD